ncbi:hypothetical protein PG996_012620 [Apiospora saccharicola]
MDEAEKV